MNVLDEVDFSGLTGLEDFDEETFDEILQNQQQQAGVPNVKLEQGMTSQSLPMPLFVRTKRLKVQHGKRSFKDYTKPIKRGFLNRQIPATDIRRFLAKILVRATNVHDPAALAATLKEFCGPSVVMTSRFIGNADHYPVKDAVLYRELHGIAHIASYLDALYQAVPDGMVRLLDSKVHMFQNGCSYIVGKFTFKGHKCFDLVTLGDTRERRMLPSKFDRRAAARQSQAAQAQAHGFQADEFKFDGMEPTAGLSDLEAFLFDDMEAEDDLVFAQHQAGLGAGLDAGGDEEDPKKQKMSVALESKSIEFMVPHSEWEVHEVALSFLGTIAFYLDPDAKIFKIEVLNTVEGEKDGRHQKKPRRF